MSDSISFLFIYKVQKLAKRVVTQKTNLYICTAMNDGAV